MLGTNTRELHSPPVLTVRVATAVHICSWDPHQGWGDVSVIQALDMHTQGYEFYPRSREKVEISTQGRWRQEDLWGSLTSQAS